MVVEIEDLIEKSHEWYNKEIRILKDGEWINSNENEINELGDEDLVVIDWNLPSERYLLVEKLGLDINIALRSAVEKLHTITRRS